MTLTTAFVPLVEKNRNPDGTYTVRGKCAGPELDLAGDVLDPGWLSKAVPAWYSSGANVREMHGMNVVGKGTEIEADAAGGWWLEAKIVDPVAITKCEHDLFTGFSVGIKNAQVQIEKSLTGGRQRRVVGGFIPEISLADRPVNPTTLFTIAKAVGVGDKLVVPPGSTVDDVYTVIEDGDGKHTIVKCAELHEDVAPVTDDDDAVLVIGKAVVSEQPVPPTGAPADGLEAVTVKLLAGVERSLTKAVAADTVKADELPLIRSAIAAIAELIQLEAVELPNDSAEVWDIESLLCALRALRDFWWAESAEGEVPAPDVVETEVETVELATVADLVKAASADDADDTVKAQLVEIRSALGVMGPEDLTKAISSAVETALKPLADELAEVRSMAAPTDVLTSRTGAGMITKAARIDELHEKSQACRAAALASTDPSLRSGLLDRARSFDRELAALRSS